MSKNSKSKAIQNPLGSIYFTIFSILPVLVATVLLSFFDLFPNNKVSATPVSATNPSLSMTVDTATNIHFNATDLNNSAFKSQAFGVKVTTDCRTGYTMSLSDSDEDTDLKSANPLNTTNITSIATDNHQLPQPPFLPPPMLLPLTPNFQFIYGMTQLKMPYSGGV